MERGDKAFAGSEEFKKSLEPRLTPRVRAGPGSAGKRRPAQKKPFSLPRFDRPKAHAAKRPAPHPHHHHRKQRFEVFAAIYLFLLLVLVMFLAASTDTGPFIVFFAFLPTLFTVVIAMIVYEAARDNKHVLWAIPLVLIFAFHWYGRTNGGFVGEVDIDVVTALNVLTSFLYLIVNYFLLQSPVQGSIRVVEKEVIPDDLSKFIASIEDKGKALNFVIGRVYNAYHGGSKELRERINMKQEWYDQFSQLPDDPAKVDFVALSALITTIESRLRLLEKSESEIFGEAQQRFKNLVRDPAGKDRIVEVLDRNDKDPVKSYVEGALQFCGKVKDFIKKRQGLGVKNEYVSRPGGAKKKGAPRSSWSKDALRR
ncbi:hypothetical protein GF367_01020 [Candidatus Woesearchaeota archaeon]|nr:hypothetical protein [Candidatus Woesearchaeota archaeon]